MPLAPSFTYTATLIKVVDGDTIDVLLDLGFDIKVKQRLRLAHINTPEMDTPAGRAAKAHLATLLADVPLIITTSKDRRDKWQRYLATIYANDIDINAHMIASGHAVGYEGGTRA